jgi:SpoVK/Ycf46/Vps4 family AAA+-type ATPase
MNARPSLSGISDRFASAVALHVVKHALRIPSVRPPLVLGIHGPSGEGKTFQCEQVFHVMRVQTLRLSGADLESDRAGEPARVLAEKYAQACDVIAKRHAPMAVLFINDLDAGLGRWGANYQYTVNTQIVTATLMHLADYDEIGHGSGRAPIIATGNDFTRLYQPLVRLGRMSLFEWKPTRAEKLDTVRPLFAPLGVSDDDLKQLISEFYDEPIAFFAELRARLADRPLLRLIDRVGLSKILTEVQYMSPGKIVEEARLELKDLFNFASELRKTSRIVSHLKSADEGKRDG